MNNSKRLTLRGAAVCIGIALGALVILSLVGVADTVRAQNPATEQVVFNFTSATGYGPTGLNSDAAGNFYVGNYYGGGNGGCKLGCGDILKVSSSGEATVLHIFGAAGVHKYNPDPSGPAKDAEGNLYWAVAYGGSSLYRGSVLKFTPSGAEGTLYAFTGGHDGAYPYGGVTVDSAGNLYGTTYGGGGRGCGGSGCGTVYRLTSSGTETVLYSFTDGADGAYPEASPILDAAGNLYGTTSGGGDLNCSLNSFNGGCGTVWKLDASGNLTVLYAFMGGTDGGIPQAGLVIDPSGNLYGDASEGGDLSCFPPYGCGTAFEINSSGNFTVLHTFTGGPSDGQVPYATLLRDSAGNLYGMTYEGGDLSCSSGAGCGVVFKLASSGKETILHAFTGGTTDGEYPESALVTDGKGNLYGTTKLGGTANGGVIFQVQTQ